MTREDFLQSVQTTFTPEQIIFIQFAIYFNPDHINYYENYHFGNYDWCYDYLNIHAFGLTIKDVPKNFKAIAKKMINHTNLISQN